MSKTDSLYQKNFYYSDLPEPHRTRRRQILKEFPEVKYLFGYCKKTKWIVTGLVIIQLLIAANIHLFNGLFYFLVIYGVSAFINQALLLAIHELSHNLAFKSPLHNRLFSLFANFPIGFPSAVTFQHYHIDHHKFQGHDRVDTDIPSAWECRFFGQRSFFMLRKIVWLFFQSLFYALRPMLTYPKKPVLWEVINMVTCLLFNTVIVYFFGWYALLYLMLGSLLGMGLHPVAGHFISEHYVFTPEQETYSYYGPLNWLTFNVGYHNEHHDFPAIPGSRLPKLRQIAGKYYDDLSSYTSWTKVLVDFVVNPDIGPYSRVKR